MSRIHRKAPTQTLVIGRQPASSFTTEPRTSGVRNHWPEVVAEDAVRAADDLVGFGIVGGSFYGSTQIDRAHLRAHNLRHQGAFNGEYG
jgi:hypothetical protein